MACLSQDLLQDFINTLVVLVMNCFISWILFNILFLGKGGFGFDKTNNDVKINLNTIDANFLLLYKPLGCECVVYNVHTVFIDLIKNNLDNTLVKLVFLLLELILLNKVVN